MRKQLLNRNGVTLLFVVSMIVLFMLLATTFLVISSQYLRGAKSYSKSEIFEAEPQNELDQVMYMLLRDTLDPNNPMRGHSLLADVYGYNQHVTGNIRNGSAQYVANSENAFIQVILEGGGYQTLKSSHLGQYLTITSGGMQGVTCRIVGHVYDAAAGDHYFRIAPILDNFYTDATNLITALNVGPDILINGRPFSGTGAGYTAGAAYNADDSFGAMDVADKKLVVAALNPNQVGIDQAGFLAGYVGDGDVNEDYDAADYQNCFLAAEVPVFNPATNAYTIAVLPSFHRPALVHNQGAAVDTVFRPLPAANPNFPQITGLAGNTQTFGLGDVDGNGDRRFDWDVDNDNDLVKDSVWIDPNLPIVTDKSGRTYKRMFAILCRDMDGRFNINAHTNRFHLDNQFANGITESFAAEEQRDMMSGALLSRSTLTASTDSFNPQFPTGLGVGPGEINMKTIFASTARNQDMQQLMYGNPGNNVWGRNGRDFGFANPEPGFVQGLATDLNTTIQFHDVPIGLPNFAGAYGSYADIHGRIGFGVDYNGQPVFSLTTLAGSEIYENQYERNLLKNGQGGYSKTANRAGTIANHQKDAPFSYAEIERILRGNDNDASSLPSRITDLAPNTFNLVNTSANRNATMYARMNFGGHSVDIPNIPTDIVGELREILQGVGGLNGLALEEALEEMLPPEFFMHQKFDINRLFGDGLDDNRIASSGGVEIDQDDVVDNHWGLWSQDLEATPSELDKIDEAIINEIDAAGRQLDLDNDGLIGNADTDEHLVRYKYARTLYVLMRTILYTSGFDAGASQADIEKIIGAGQDFNGDGMTNNIDLAIFVAQWSINVVDFKDKDSIMTPFEFDLNPFNGWNVDGNPLYSDVWRDGQNNPIDIGGGMNRPESDRYIVFGCEKPNLLMTETFAFHDRRTEDRDDEDAGAGNAETKSDGDSDSDQRLKPEGSVFLELYNPNGLSTVRTADVYDNNGGNNTSNDNGINLGRTSITNGVTDTAGTVSTKRSPVWRIVMTRGNLDLDFGTAAARNTRRRDNVERVIYFVWEDNGDMTFEVGEYLKSDLQYELHPRVVAENGMFLLTENVYKNSLVSLTSLSSAVIGTGKFQIGATESYINPLGRRTDVADETMDIRYNQTRSITITAGSGANAVVVRDLDAAGTETDYGKFTLGIPFIDLNISEPIGGYDLGGRTPLPLTTTDMGGTMYTETVYADGMGMPYVFDEPLDRNSRPMGGNNNLDNFPNDNVTVRGYRWFHLQRLANPLAGWHPETNPYLTVDTMPVDLSVFDGVSAGDFGAFSAGQGFGTRERGQDQATNRNLWRVELANTVQTAQTAAADNHHHSFYLENPNTANVEEESLGHTKLGAADQINHVYDLINNPTYSAAGQTPTFNWLTWNNRPFVNQYELMCVPHTSSAQMLRTFTVNNQPANPIYGDNTPSRNSGFGHLVNFFQGSQTGGAEGPDFCRMFDLVYVPSRFAGTRTYLNNGAGTFGSQNGPDLYLDLNEATTNADSTNYVDDNDKGFSAPMNFLSNQREPGKINMNTLFTQEIWSGLNGGYVGEGGHGVASFGEFVNSRRRGTPGGTTLGATGVNIPTFFPSPYRSANAGNLMPDIAALPLQTPANTGLMRQNAANTAPLLNTTGAGSLVNLNRQAYLRNLTRARLANLTTTKSNVYAVWITVGYFEYDEDSGQLGQEIGSNSGEVQRHRAFYMIDRSIPVAFEPGMNHNVDKAIMVRRYIE